MATRKVFDRPDGAGSKLFFSMAVFILTSGALVYAALSVDRIPVLQFVTAAGLLLFSLLLFIATCTAIKKKRLTPIYSTNLPQHLVTHGPYKYVRHPFYTAYLLNYAGIVLVAPSMLSLLALVGVYAIYLHAALQEERKFGHSGLASAYACYMSSTGRFLPMFVRK